VLQELLHVLVRRGSRDAAVRLTRHAMELVSDVLAVGRKEIALACELLELHPSLNARDAAHLATLQLNGLVSIATADRHFDQIEGIRRIDPEAPRPLE
jgi:predicted nucleic acid-binding protein